MHGQRWVTALVILPFLVLVIWLGGFFFSGFIGIVGLICMQEYYGIVLNKTGWPLWGPLPLLGFLSTIGIIGAAHADAFPVVFGVIAVNLLLSGLFVLSRFSKDNNVLDLLNRHVLGIVYVPLLICHIVLIRNGSDGATWVFFLLFLVFFGDIGAYYAGRYWGCRKLCPSVSPGKTIEGALGGLAASVGIGILFRYLFLPGLPFPQTLVLLFLVGFIAPTGDLFESVLKRVGEIKDSGTILPGHGGFLDRIDAVLFALPTVFWFKYFFVG